jgi:hypothetical protein
MSTDKQVPAVVGKDRAETREVVILSHSAEPIPERIRRLQWEARVLAADHAESFAADLLAQAERAREIAEGGEAYPPGVRELAFRTAGDLQHFAKSVLAILRQVGPRA